MAAAEGSLFPQTDTGSGSSTISVTAAVVREKGGLFTFEDLTLDTVLRPDEVLVKVVATGLCQTDIHVRDQALPTPLPVVLGHEGAGIVERVGDAVSTVTPGDRVVLSYQACGHCTPCLSGNPGYCALSFPANFGGSRLDGTNALHAGDEEIHGHFFGQSSFATHALATERNVVKVDDEDILPRIGRETATMDEELDNVAAGLTLSVSVSSMNRFARRASLVYRRLEQVPGSKLCIGWRGRPTPLVEAFVAVAKEVRDEHVNLVARIESGDLD